LLLTLEKDDLSETISFVEQPEPSAETAVPYGQTVQVSDLSLAYDPVAHTEHSLFPFPEAKCPAVQSSQGPVEPETRKAVPAGQRVHSEFPVVDA